MTLAIIKQTLVAFGADPLEMSSTERRNSLEEAVYNNREDVHLYLEADVRSRRGETQHERDTAVSFKKLKDELFVSIRRKGAELAEMQGYQAGW